ncbi:hypothetical protein [Pseudokineococcus sp. 1T1Z-3]|uniref:hypothetical protein n=1 Tax=Pseudokineococcus sp. 1T1Z-3 TaxID=3132745 RepID=UPI0030B18E95
MKKSLALSAGLALVALPLATAPALASSSGPVDLVANLTQLNDSGASAELTGTLDGDDLTLTMTTSGLLEGAPHAQHIHIGGNGTCPANGAEGSGADGAFQTSDGASTYGGIAVSLTTEGDTSPDSGLAVDRFPTGNYTYERTIEVSDEVADQIAAGDGVVVVHGVDQNGSGTYDGDVPSDLDPTLPEEATNPAACGTLDVAQMTMPEGGAATGLGGTSTTTLVVVGGAALAAAGAAGVVVARRRAAQG